ncbi:MAG: hypothetical protein GY895_17845, partial [Phycisphaera sp.]|nr:hypothetical protein [Phycisphaera sp.]
MRRSRFNALLGVLSFVMILVSTRAAMAQVTLVVDSSGNGDYTAIQPAIDAASDGDTVELVPGTYRERINLGGKKITLRGSTGLSFLHILSRPEGGSGRLVSMNGGEDATTVIEGMTIRQSTDGGMYLNNASPTIRNCRFVENTVGDQGGVVSINGTSTPRFEDCEFSDNAASGGTNIRGGAIFMTGSGVDATFVDCAFNRNLSRANQRNSRADGGAICLRSGSRLEVTDCSFDSNLVSAQSDSVCGNDTAYAIGGAIQAESDTEVVVVGCQFVENEAHVDIYDNDSSNCLNRY